jgi:hypothetical protein
MNCVMVTFAFEEIHVAWILWGFPSHSTKGAQLVGVPEQGTTVLVHKDRKKARACALQRLGN